MIRYQNFDMKTLWCKGKNYGTKPVETSTINNNNRLQSFSYTKQFLKVTNFFTNRRISNKNNKKNISQGKYEGSQKQRKLMTYTSQNEDLVIRISMLKLHQNRMSNDPPNLWRKCTIFSLSLMRRTMPFFLFFMYTPQKSNICFYTRRQNLIPTKYQFALSWFVW